MQEGTTTIKTLVLDSSFEFEVKRDDNQIWKIKDGLSLVVETSNEYEGILEYNIPAISVDGYIDLREDDLKTLESTLKSQLGLDISIYALEQDDKLAPRALEFKKILLDVFERK